MFVALALFFAQTPAVPSSAIGSWLITESIDPVTDRRTVRASVENADSTARLSYSCEVGRPRNPLYASFTSTEFLGRAFSPNVRELIVRAGEDKAETLYFGYSDFTAFSVLNGSLPKFEKALSRSSRFLVRAITYRNGQIDAVFDVDGADQALARIRTACGQ